MRRILVWATALALAFTGLVSSPANATTHSCTTGTFTVTGGVAENGSTCSGVLNLPQGVTEVAASAFQFSGVTSISFPSTLTAINLAAFASTQLTSLTIPGTVEYIGDGAFSSISTLQTLVIQPGALFSIENATFSGNYSMTSVSIPDNVIKIRDNAFRNATGNPSALTSITLPPNLDYIGYYAFEGQDSLTSITIPSRVEYIEYHAFKDCTSLSTVTFLGLGAPTTHPDAFLNIGNSPTAQIQSRASRFGFAGEVWNGLTVVRAPEAGLIAEGTFDCATGARQNVVSQPNIRVEGGTTVTGWGCTGAVVIPNGVLSIGKWSLGDSNGPTSFSLPNTVTSIAEYAFAYAEDMVSVNIPTSVTSIGYRAFYEADSLVTITIPASVVTLGEEVFSRTNALTSVVIQGGITSIPNRTFRQAYALASVTIPNSVTSIGLRAFQSSGLTSITIPSSVTSIGDQAFADTSLTSITIPNSVTSIGDNVFFEAAFLTSVTLPDGITAIPSGMFASTGLTSFEIPGTVTAIEPSAFAYSQLSSISIPNSVTYIGQSAFMGTDLTSISIPQGVTTIESYLLYGASSLASVTIPSSVTSIDFEAFSGTTSLTSIYFMGNVPPTTHADAFLGVDASAVKIRLQPGNTGFGSSWNGFAVVGAVDDGTYACSNGLAAISGARYTITNRVVSSGSTCSGPVFVPPGVTSVAASAFDGASSMTSITLPSTVTSLGQRSFAGATSLTSVTIPSSVTTIGASAFAGANSLSNIYFMGNAPTTVGVNAFSGVANAAQARIYLGVTGFGIAGSLWNGLVVTPPATQSQNNNQNQNQNNSVVAPVPVPAFNIKPLAVAFGSKTLTINGNSLTDVTSIKIAGKAAKIVQKQSGDIVVEVPSLAEGYHDVEIAHATGVITLQGMLQIVKPYELKRTQTITQFKGNVPTAASLAALKKLYLKGTTANLVNCFATVASNAPASAVARATAQAKATCQAALNFSVQRMSVNVRVSKTGKAGSKPALAVTFDRTLTAKR